MLIATLEQVFAVNASLAAGPAAVTVAVALPEVRPVAAAVTVQEPGTPVIVSVVVVVLPPAAIVPEDGDTLQTDALSTDQVTVVLAVAVVVTPLASWRVAVAVVELAVPAGKADWPRVTAIFAGAPAAVKVTLTWQPVRLVDAAESWSVPVVPAAGALSVNVATPFVSVPVAGAPAAPESIVLVVPACETVIERPLSPVTVFPRES